MCDSRNPSPESNSPIQKSGLRGTPYPMATPKSIMRAAAERGEHGVVEGGAGRQVGALDAEMIEHPSSFSSGATRILRCG